MKPIENNTLSKTIHVKRIDVSPRLSRPLTGSLGAIAPVDSPYPSPLTHPKNPSYDQLETPAMVDELLQPVVLKPAKHMGQWAQAEYKRLVEQMSHHWLSLDRAQMTVNKYGPQHCFKISDVSKEMYKSFKNKRGNNLIYSDIFETHRFGYKMVAILEPFGDGNARTEYISVYVALVKGNFDPILEWPFALPVTFALRKPGTQNSYKKTIYPPNDNDQECFYRPASGRNRAFGFQYFFPIAELANFSRIDDIYIDIIVDVSKLDSKPNRA